MSYAQGIEVIMHPVTPSGGGTATYRGGGDAVLSATTVIARWGPGYFTHKLHAMSVVITNLPAAMANTTPVKFFHHRPWTGTNGATVVGTINLPTTIVLTGTGPIGAFHRVTSNVTIRPGESIAVQPTTAPTAQMRGLCVLYVSPSHEQPTIGRSVTGDAQYLVQTT